jgi:hypothetical protein
MRDEVTDDTCPGWAAPGAQISGATLRLVYMALGRHSARRDDMLGLIVN